jgi:hypothetical protein
MKKLALRFLLSTLALFAIALPEASFAQVVTQIPVFISPNAGVTTDLGNGPMELKAVLGNAMIGTSQGSGVGSGTTTSITLTATPAVPPCIGCLISGVGVTSGTTVTAYNGTTGITTNTSQTIAASTALSWGAACPATYTGFAAMPLQAGVTPDLPMYTQARVCAYAQNAAGAQVMPFPIGAH